MLTLGIDIGGSSVKAALLDGGTCRAVAESDRYSRPDRATLARAIRAATAGVVRTGPRPIERVGLCAPGLMDRPTLTITHAPNVPGIVGLPLGDLIAEAIETPRPARAPIVTTDAHATAYDISCRERCTGRLLCIALGTGVGASVLDEGAPLHVSGETPGHFGHIDVSLGPEPPRGTDGAAGSLEAYIGLPALVARGCIDVDSSPPSLRSHAMAEPVRALARAIRIAHAVYRPAHIRLAGGVGVLLKPELPRLRGLIDHELTSLARPGWTLACAEDTFHAARGVARLAANEGV